MKHSISLNSCPFCGNNIFTSKEFAFRRSLYKILVKNGLDNEDMISRISDDVISSIFVSADESDGSSPEDEIKQMVDEDDGLSEKERSAPSRQLSPGSPPSARAGESKVDPIAAAMAAFEQDNSDKEQPFSRQGDGVLQDDPRDADGVFFMESGNNDVVEKKRQMAADAKRAGLVNAPPAFKRRDS